MTSIADELKFDFVAKSMFCISVASDVFTAVPERHISQFVHPM